MTKMRASASFIFVTILLDVIGYGLIIPVMRKWSVVAPVQQVKYLTPHWLLA